MDSGNPIGSELDFGTQIKFKLKSVEINSFEAMKPYRIRLFKKVKNNDSVIKLGIDYFNDGSNLIDSDKHRHKSIDEKYGVVTQQIITPLLEKIKHSLLDSPYMIAGENHGLGVGSIYLIRNKNAQEPVSSYEKCNIALLLTHANVDIRDCFKTMLTESIKIYIKDISEKKIKNVDNNLITGIQNLYYANIDSDCSPNNKLHVAKALLLYIDSNILQTLWSLGNIPKFIFETFHYTNFPIKNKESLSTALKDGKLSEIYFLCDKYINILYPPKEEIEKQARTIAMLKNRLTFFSCLPREINTYIASLAGDRMIANLPISKEIAENAYDNCKVMVKR